jgi:hypothetical protein
VLEGVKDQCSINLMVAFSLITNSDTYAISRPKLLEVANKDILGGFNRVHLNTLDRYHEARANEITATTS